MVSGMLTTNALAKVAGVFQAIRLTIEYIEYNDSSLSPVLN